MSDEATTAEAGAEQEAPVTPATEAAPEAAAETPAEETPVEGGGEPAEPASEGEQEPEKPEAAESAQETPEPPALPPALVARAVRAGMEDDEILGHTPEALERACALLERRAPKGEAAAQQSSSPVPQEFKLDLKDPTTGQDIPEDQIDPVMMKNLNGMTQFANSLAKAAHQQFGYLQSAIQAIQTQAHVDWLDSAVTGLGEQYQELFGKGTIHDLDPKSPQIQNRIKLDNAMATIANGCVARGRAVPNKKELFQQALGMQFGSQAKTQARKEVAAKLDKQASQMTARPSQRTATPPPPLTPDEEARKAARSKMAELGLLNSEETPNPKRRK